MKQLKTLLGIVLYERTLCVCDVEHNGTSYDLRKSAEYTLPKAVTIENLASDSAGFKAFLKEHGFRSKTAIVGLPAKHMLSTFVKLPPIQDSRARHDTIRINLERKLEIDLDDIVFDYDATQQLDNGTILIMMLLKKQLFQVKELLRAANITPVQITNTSLGLDLSTRAGVTCHVIEYPSSFELCLFRDGSLSALQQVAKDSNQPLTMESARKITRQVNRMCLSLGLSGPVYYCIHSPTAPTDSTNKELSDVFSGAKFRNLKATADCTLLGPASELAGRFIVTGSKRFNFLNGRHEEHTPTRLSQGLRKSVIPAAAIVLLIGWFLAGWYSDNKRIKTYQQQLDNMGDNVTNAQKVIDRVTYAKRWFQQEPDHLEILRQLSLSFPQNSNIWLTSLAIDGSLNQILTGRAVNEESVLDVAEELRSRAIFDDVKILYIRKMGKETNIMNFAINLQYRKEI